MDMIQKENILLSLNKIAEDNQSSLIVYTDINKYHKNSNALMLKGIFCLVNDQKDILSASFHNFNNIDLEILTKLNSLNSVDLRYTQLLDHHFLSKIPNLHNLNMGYNNLSDLTFLKDLKKISRLDLNRNNIENIDVLKEFKNLTSLNLGSNNITNISSLKELYNLRYLNLSYNSLKDVNWINNLINLKYLDLSYNEISELTPLINLIALISLKIHGNNVKDISFLKELKKLTSVSLEGNPIIQPSPIIIRQGIKAILNYFQESDKSFQEEYLYEAKLVIVGRGAVGKTVLTKKLTVPSFTFNKNQATTHGIDVLKNPFKLEIEGSEGHIEYRFNIWDFGGQEKYDATHQFFITERSVYLFLTDARQEDNYLDFDYWLNTIKILGSSSPVIIVITKIDERKKKYPQYQYKGQYSNIIDFIEVSCMPGFENTIEYLKHKISEAALNLPQSNEKLPKIWVDIRKKLEELSLSKDYISYDEYLSVCKKYGMNEVRALYLSQFLNDLGVIIHQQKDLLLKRSVIINTEWGIDGVYKVLDNENVICTNGFFTKSELKNIWNEEKYAKRQAELLQLMINYKLCFECKDGKGYIAPTLLPYDKPDNYEWDDHNNLKLEYNYSFMPAGLAARFIVEAHEYIRNNLFWKYGVIIEYDKTYALIEEDHIHKKIKIKVKGENNQGALSFIRMVFKSIHGSFEKLEYKELIPCNCFACKYSSEPTMFDFGILRQYQKEKAETIICTKEKIKNVNVNMLINDIEPDNEDIPLEEEEIYDALFKPLVKTELSKETNTKFPLNKKISLNTTPQKRWYEKLHILIAIVAGIITIIIGIIKLSDTEDKSTKTQHTVSDSLHDKGTEKKDQINPSDKTIHQNK